MAGDAVDPHLSARGTDARPRASSNALSSSTPPEPQVLECPCCGDDGAMTDRWGRFYDGQPLKCGCVGWVSVGEDDVWINNGDDECPATAKCRR